MEVFEMGFFFPGGGICFCGDGGDDGVGWFVVCGLRARMDGFMDGRGGGWRAGLKRARLLSNIHIISQQGVAMCCTLHINHIICKLYSQA